jgi:hypothetical protein
MLVGPPPNGKKMYDRPRASQQTADARQLSKKERASSSVGSSSCSGPRRPTASTSHSPGVSTSRVTTSGKTGPVLIDGSSSHAMSMKETMIFRAGPYPALRTRKPIANGYCGRASWPLPRNSKGAKVKSGRIERERAARRPTPPSSASASVSRTPAADHAVPDQCVGSYQAAPRAIECTVTAPRGGVHVRAHAVLLERRALGTVPLPARWCWSWSCTSRRRPGGAGAPWVPHASQPRMSRRVAGRASETVLGGRCRIRCTNSDGIAVCHAHGFRRKWASDASTSWPRTRR